MARSIPAATVAEMLKSRSGWPVVTLLTLDHTSFAQPYRFTDNNEDVVYSANTYLTFPFKFTLPDNAEGLPNSTLTISNVDRRLIADIRSLQGQIDCTAYIVRLTATTPELIAGPILLKMLGVVWNAQELQFDLGLSVQYINTKATKGNFNPRTAPGLW